MRITNRHNLPETIINVLHRPAYSKGDAHLSVTELINSPRIVQLRKAHWNDIEEDAADMIWSLFGSALHNILQHGKASNHIVEKRLFHEVDGWRVSGALDLMVLDKNGVSIFDYKCTSVWSVMADKVEWQRQLNVYAWLVEKTTEHKVNSLQIVAILRDWSAREASVKDGYPQAPIVVIDVPLWSIDVREDYVRKRITQHNAALFAAETGEQLPECSKEDCWEKPTEFAVKKKGNKRATAVFLSKDEAEKKQQDLGDSYELEVRPGERTRCERFCSVSKWCNQFHQYKEGKNESL